MLKIDHLVVAALDLAEGAGYVEGRLGVSLSSGGSHPLMGTHNRLLRLGEALFLEVIAVEPGADAPDRPRWFGLDIPGTLVDAPRLITWVAGTSDISAALSEIPDAVGPAISARRGTLEWLISVPADGSMPFDGAFPTLLEWPPGPHPAKAMPDRGCSLVELRVTHPRAEAIRSSLAAHLQDPRVRFARAPETSLQAIIHTPGGTRQLR